MFYCTLFYSILLYSYCLFSRKCIGFSLSWNCSWLPLCNCTENLGSHVVWTASATFPLQLQWTRNAVKHTHSLTVRGRKKKKYNKLFHYQSKILYEFFSIFWPEWPDNLLKELTSPVSSLHHTLGRMHVAWKKVHIRHKTCVQYFYDVVRHEHGLQVHRSFFILQHKRPDLTYVLL